MLLSQKCYSKPHSWIDSAQQHDIRHCARLPMWRNWLHHLVSGRSCNLDMGSGMIFAMSNELNSLVVVKICDVDSSTRLFFGTNLIINIISLLEYSRHGLLNFVIDLIESSRRPLCMALNFCTIAIRLSKQSRRSWYSYYAPIGHTLLPGCSMRFALVDRYKLKSVWWCWSPLCTKLSLSMRDALYIVSRLALINKGLLDIVQCVGVLSKIEDEQFVA